MDCSTFAFDLHVLGTPPALILSQDQTLKLNSLFHLHPFGLRRINLLQTQDLNVALGFESPLANPNPKVRAGSVRLIVKFGWFQRPEGRRPPADTQLGLPCVRALRRLSRTLCLHVLSSFQRTESPLSGPPTSQPVKPS